MKEWLKKVWRWLRREVLNKDLLQWFIIAEIIFWTPCIVGAILAALIDPWFWAICAAYMAFWALPLTPAIPLQIGLAIGLKKAAEAMRKHRKNKKGDKDNDKNNDDK